MRPEGGGKKRRKVREGGRGGRGGEGKLGLADKPRRGEEQDRLDCRLLHVKTMCRRTCGP